MVVVLLQGSVVDAAETICEENIAKAKNDRAIKKILVELFWKFKRIILIFIYSFNYTIFSTF